MGKNITDQVLKYSVVFEEAAEGGYTVYVPSLPGCITEGDNFEEAKENAKEAIIVYLASMAKDGEMINKPHPFILGTVDVYNPNYNFA